MKGRHPREERSHGRQDAWIRLTIHTGLHPEMNPVAAVRHAEQPGFDLVTRYRDALHGTDPAFEDWKGYGAARCSALPESRAV